MTDSFRELAGLDRTLHAPPRLAILTALLNCQKADFNFLLTATGLTKGNLASNLATLEKAGLIGISKELNGKRSRTNCYLTGKGRAATSEHWETLERMKTSLLRAPGMTSQT